MLRRRGLQVHRVERLQDPRVSEVVSEELGLCPTLQVDLTVAVRVVVRRADDDLITDCRWSSSRY